MKLVNRNAKANLILSRFVFCAMIVFLYSCGSGGGDDDSSSGTGSVSFGLVMLNQDNAQASNNRATEEADEQFECQTDTYLITSIEVKVVDENGEVLAEGGPWDCEDRQGNVSDVDPGAGRIVRGFAKDESGETIFDGNSEPFSLEAGQAKDVGRILLEPVNSAPVLSPIGDQPVNEGQLLEFNIEATDPDNDGLSFFIDNPPPGASFVDNGDGVATFSWIPGFGMAGVYDVTFIVADDGVPSLSDSENITITVAEVNQPPVLTPIGAKIVDEGQLLEFTISATDPDGDGLSFSIGNQPTGASFVDNGNGTATFSWTPGFDVSGNYPVIFTVTDDSTQAPGPLSDFEEVTITVGDVCRPPVLDPIGPKSVKEDELLEFIIAATDSDIEDSLSFSIGNKPEGANFDDNNDGTATFNWTPGFEDATTPNYKVIFTVTDDCLPPEGPLSDFEEVTIVVGDNPRPPVLDPIGSKTVNEGQLLEFAITATDPDSGDILSYSCSSEDLDCDALFDANTQTFSWTPGFDATDNYKVVFIVTDDSPPPDGPLSDFEEVTITVGDVDRPPVLAPIGDKSVDEMDRLEFTITGKDPDPGDILSYSCSSEDLDCDALFDANTQTFSWRPGFEDAGIYDVRFTVTDDAFPSQGGPLSDFEDLTITVADVPRPPVLDPIGPKTLNEGGSLAFTITASDPDGDCTTITAGLNGDVGKLPTGAEFIDNGNCTATFSWRPGFEDAGIYDVRFTVTDNVSLSDFEDVKITVVDQCPDLVVDSISDPIWDSKNRRSVIQATIRNIGNAAADPSLARVIDPTTLQETGAPFNDIAPTGVLAPGASVPVTFFLPYWVYNPDVTLEVTADYKNEVSECSEGNNVLVFEDQG